MSSQQQKPKSVGSAYINVAKDAPQALKDEIAGIVGFLTESKAYLSISVLRSDGQYAKLTGFFNEFKRNPQDPDVVIRNSIKATQTKQGGYAKKSYGRPAPAPQQAPRGGYTQPQPQPEPTQAPAQQAEGDEFGGEGVPFA